jgi:hypothetical protein
MDGRDPGSTPGVAEERAVEPLICRHLGPVPLNTLQFNNISRINLAFWFNAPPGKIGVAPVWSFVPPVQAAQASLLTPH